MSTKTINLNIISVDEDGDECTVEQECEVTFEYHRAYRGYRNSLGVPEEPDEEAGFEIESVKDEAGKEVPYNKIEGGEEAVIHKLED